MPGISLLMLWFYVGQRHFVFRESRKTSQMNWLNFKKPYRNRTIGPDEWIGWIEGRMDARIDRWQDISENKYRSPYNCQYEGMLNWIVREP